MSSMACPIADVADVSPLAPQLSWSYNLQRTGFLLICAHGTSLKGQQSYCPGHRRPSWLGWDSRLPHPQAGIFEAWSVLSPEGPRGMEPQLPTLVTGLITHSLLPVSQLSFLQVFPGATPLPSPPRLPINYMQILVLGCAALETQPKTYLGDLTSYLLCIFFQFLSLYSVFSNV